MCWSLDLNPRASASGSVFLSAAELYWFCPLGHSLAGLGCRSVGAGPGGSWKPQGQVCCRSFQQLVWRCLMVLLWGRAVKAWVGMRSWCSQGRWQILRSCLPTLLQLSSNSWHFVSSPDLSPCLQVCYWKTMKADAKMGLMCPHTSLKYSIFTKLFMKFLVTPFPCIPPESAGM